MIFIDLKERVRKVRKPRVWRPLLVGLVLAATGLWGWRRQASLAENRPLTIEERESVISLFDPIARRLPQIRIWSETFFEDFTRGHFALSIQHDLPQGRLVWLKDDHLVFSPAFFNADPMTQSQWLVQVMAEANPPLENQPEVASTAHAPVSSVE